MAGACTPRPRAGWSRARGRHERSTGMARTKAKLTPEELRARCARCGHSLLDHAVNKECVHGAGTDEPCECVRFVAMLAPAAEPAAAPAAPTALVTTPAGGLMELPLGDVIPTPENPRRIRPDDPAVRELAESIREMGLLQPVVCRPHPSLPGKYDLRAGHRRWLAHGLIGAERILAIVREMTDGQAMQVTVLENLQRQDLTALEEARGVNALLRSGMSAEEAGRQIGKSARWVYARAQLQDLAPRWEGWFESQTMPPRGKGTTTKELALTVRHLELLVRFPVEVQERLADACEEEPWRLGEGRWQQFRDWIGSLTGRLTLAPWDLHEAWFDPLDKGRKAGTTPGCTLCERRARRRQQWLFVPGGERGRQGDADAARHCPAADAGAGRGDGGRDADEGVSQLRSRGRGETCQTECCMTGRARSGWKGFRQKLNGCCCGCS